MHIISVIYGKYNDSWDPTPHFVLPGIPGNIFLLFIIFLFTTEAALEEYSRKRTVDAHAICDLAMYNYVEMRSKVSSRPCLCYGVLWCHA